MWHLDFPEHDPDSNHPKPSAKQRLYAEQAGREVDRLKRTLEKMTVPQQRSILGKIRDQLVGGVFRHEPLTIDPAAPNVTRIADASGQSHIKAEFPEHESEGQALTEASQTDE